MCVCFSVLCSLIYAMQYEKLKYLSKTRGQYQNDPDPDANG